MTMMILIFLLLCWGNFHEWNELYWSHFSCDSSFIVAHEHLIVWYWDWKKVSRDFRKKENPKNTWEWEVTWSVLFILKTFSLNVIDEKSRTMKEPMIFRWKARIRTKTSELFNDRVSRHFTFSVISRIHRFVFKILVVVVEIREIEIKNIFLWRKPRKHKSTRWK